MELVASLINRAREAMSDERVIQATKRIRDAAQQLAHSITGTKASDFDSMAPYHGPDHFTALPSPLLTLVFQCLPPAHFHAALRVSRGVAALHDHHDAEPLYRRHVFDSDRCQHERGGRGFREFLHVVTTEHRLISDDTDADIRYQIGTFRGHGPRMFVSPRKIAVGWYEGPDRDNQYWSNDHPEDSVFGLTVRLVGVCWLSITSVVSLPAPSNAESVYQYRVWFRVGVNHRTSMASPTVSITPTEAHNHMCSVTSEPREVTDWMFRQLVSDPESVVMGVGNDRPAVPATTTDTGNGDEKQNSSAAMELIEGEDQHEAETAPPRNQAEVLMRHAPRIHRARLGVLRRHPRPMQLAQADNARVMRELLVGDIEVRGGVLNDVNGAAPVSCVDLNVRMMKTGLHEPWKRDFWLDGIIVERRNA